jgi:hypothetical protein
VCAHWRPIIVRRNDLRRTHGAPTAWGHHRCWWCVLPWVTTRAEIRRCHHHAARWQKALNLHSEFRIRADSRAGWQVRITFDTDAHTQGCIPPPSVVCALWSTTVLSDDTRYLSGHVHQAGHANTARRRNVRNRKHIRDDTRCHPRCSTNLGEGKGSAAASRTTTLPAAQQIPRAVAHGPRNGTAMSAIQTVVTVVSLSLFGVGMHDLQSWLERRDYERHFND